jgi:hypothetical protein
LTPVVPAIITNCMARTEKNIDELRNELAEFKQRQFQQLAEHRLLVAQLDLASDGQSAVLLEQRRWNASPPLRSPQGSISPTYPQG